MAFADRTHVAETNGRDSSHAREVMAGALLVVLLAALGIRRMVPAEVVTPALVTLLFAGSAVIAGVALLCRRDQFRIMWVDLAGCLTFIGIVISVFIEPDQLARLISASDRPE